MSKLSLKIDPDLVLDLNKPLVCEVVWDNGTQITQCTNIATWVALCHDEVEAHDNWPLLFCDECLIVAEYKNVCPEDNEKLIQEARQL